MPERLRALGLALLLVCGLGGCAQFKCSAENCAVDAKITADVRALLKQHTEFGAPEELQVQTINRVVYLHGLVNSDLERQSAEALVRQVANVADVVNSISPRGNGAW